MTGDEFGLLMVPLTVFGVTAVIAYALGMARSVGWFGAVAVCWAGATLAMYVGMEQAGSWDTIGFLVVLIGICAPIGAGLGIGGMVGWLRSGTRKYA